MQASTREEWLEDASHHKASGDLERAVASYRNALAASDDSETMAELGACLSGLGQFDEAISLLRKALEREPGRHDWQIRLWHMLVASGDRASSETQFKTVWNNAPSGRLVIELSFTGWSAGLSYFGDPSAQGEARTLVARLDAATQVRGKEKESEEIAMIERLDAIAPQPIAFWLYLFGRLIVFGHAQAAYAAKRIAAKITLRHAPELASSRVELEAVVTAAIYLDEFAAGLDAIGRYRTANPQLSGWDDRRSEADLLLSCGRIAEAREIARNVVTGVGAVKFSRLLSNKSCAVVGPAKNDLANGENIDRHDLVVRTNFVGSSALAPHASMVGTKTDVAYYNIPFIHSRMDKLFDTLRDERPKFVVARNQTSRRLLSKHSPGLRARKWISYKKYNFIGVGFAMRHILFDMALLGDGPLSVFGADFYLGADPHYAGYFDEGINITKSFAEHDPFDTFALMRALYMAGAIKPDRILAEILEQTPVEFAKRLSQRFGG